MSKKQKLRKHIFTNALIKDKNKNTNELNYKSRLTVPFNLRCLNCNEQIAKGKKFYSSKQISKNEDYLGIEIYKFEFKCPGCRIGIGFKTDPKNCIYLPDYNCKDNTNKDRKIKEIEKEDLNELHKKITKKIDLEEIKRKLKKDFDK